MRIDKKALKEKLLKQYSDHLDQVFDQIEDDHQLHISEIEEIALEVRQDVGEDVTEALTEQSSQQRDVDVDCPSCHQRMRAKGHKPKWIKTQSGNVRVQRAYYYCEACGKGHFPPR